MRSLPDGSGYQLIAEAHGMPKNAEYLRVRLKMERHRLLNWAAVAELTEENESLSHNSRSLACDALRQKEQLLLGFVSLEMRCTTDPDANPVPSTGGHDDDLMVIDGDTTITKFISRTDSETEMNRAQFLLKKQSLLAKSLRLAAEKSEKVSNRVRWVAFDKKKFEILLEKLSALNDYMLELLKSNMAETTPPPLQGPTSKEKKYDRQLRLWAASGQQALEEAHVLLVNPSLSNTDDDQANKVLGTGVVGIEALKNLILPGIGNYTIVDNATVSEEDLGVNFFLEEQSLGKSRAEETCRLLQELNPDVKGNFISKVPRFQLANFLC